MGRKESFLTAQPRSSQIALAVAVLALAGISACSVNPNSKAGEKEAEPGSKSAGQQTATQADPRIDLNCVYDHLQNPSESFHYVYKKNASDGYPVDQEADVTPQTLDGFWKLQDGSKHEVHAVHSDPQGWQSALAGLTGISGMSSTVATFNNSSALRRETDGGQVNGYSTIHYSIDTARWDATTRQMVGNFALGPGGFDKGDAWVTSDGCPVKLSLDEEMHKKDGSLLDHVHYEIGMIKK